MTRRLRYGLLGLASLLVLGLASPALVRLWWRVHAANPVRDGVRLARDLGCFSCHGELGGSGIRDPGAAEGVPEWNGGVWMMYVKGDDDVRQMIRLGSAGREHHEHHEDETPIEMPGYGDLSAGDLDDLVAAFRILSGMSRPAAETPARRGYELARSWRCFSCHGPGASGGLPNPRSFTGFVPGWYGPDFAELVRSREEFDRWIREGALPRITDHPVAGWFQRRQRLSMPVYSVLTPAELDDLWAYAGWLRDTGGGVTAEIGAW